MRILVYILIVASMLGGAPLCGCAYAQQECGPASSVGSSNQAEVDCRRESCSRSEMLDQSSNGMGPCGRLASVCTQDGGADSYTQGSEASPKRGHADLLAIAVNSVQPVVLAGVRNSQNLLLGSHSGTPVRLHLLCAVFLL